MKTALTLAVLAALAATPVLAKNVQQGNMAQQHQAANNETIRDAQQALERQGYQIGQVDGVLGKRTHQALRQFQLDQGINGTGQLNQQTMAALGIAPGAPQQAQVPEEPVQKNQPTQQNQHPQSQNTQNPDMQYPQSQQGGGGTR